MDINKQKIIDAWERCKKCDMSVIASEEGRKAYIECEYTTDLYCRQDMLVNDTVALLKEQEQKTGEWIEIPDGNGGTDSILCPFCRNGWSVIDNCTETFNYCPHCGAKMVE